MNHINEHSKFAIDDINILVIKELNYYLDLYGHDSMYNNLENYTKFLEVFTNIRTGHLPDTYDPDILECYSLRKIYTQFISWCLVSNIWIDLLSRFLKDKTCIDVFAGLGMVSKALQDKGVNIIPYDDNSWKCTSSAPKFTNVINKDAVSAIKEFNNPLDYILMSWVPYEDDDDEHISIEVLNTIKKYHPESTIIWIGEDYGGCNGCEEFFELIEVIPNKRITRINDYFQQWEGIHDQIILMKPKTN